MGLQELFQQRGARGIGPAVGTKVILVSTRRLYCPLNHLIHRSFADCDLFVVSPMTVEHRFWLRRGRKRTASHRNARRLLRAFARSRPLRLSIVNPAVIPLLGRAAAAFVARQLGAVLADCPHLSHDASRTDQKMEVDDRLARKLDVALVVA